MRRGPSDGVSYTRPGKGISTAHRSGHLPMLCCQRAQHSYLCFWKKGRELRYFMTSQVAVLVTAVFHLRRVFRLRMKISLHISFVRLHVEPPKSVPR